MSYNHFTKYCYKLYSGCFNIDCNFAHCANELRASEEYARKDVKFEYVENDTLPKFIIRFDDDDDEDEEDYEAPCLSLSMIEKSNAVFLEKKKNEVFEARMNMMENVLSELLRDISLSERGCKGGADMDLSD